MKRYKFLAHTVSGHQGEIKELNPTAAATQQLLKLGFIEELKEPDAAKREKKVVKPTETKTKQKRGRKKKGD